ncbi:monovalent cation:proton antiporter-2 (CPA2) family protein [Albimonas sp. CAU 1670]|uniref:monovalent cation:proton antiporter-2 (CPA2) family protein n=1 Tax=Albimonas sp. CAU 1670 TaxID=3032599 RepID=UPI0023DAA070|nr:monovalent cation:proton antiporter-2 (CPA2) family protein [Albimonas sp. CAU 1670]MDF2231537.1 monovalent cation:proton antiporter-2 (CPA2) family protein [Albimonas sp. CAU 1670]
MATEADPAFLETATVFLGAAVLAVPIFKRAGLGSVIGYLAAGALIGPYGLALVSDVQTVVGFAEFGVVLLLFVIGLELRLGRLWRMRYEIFGLGLAQVVLTGALLFPLLRMVGFGWRGALVLGGALALSSTAFAVQLLRERGDLTRPYGDRSFSILLFQDLAIVPLLAMIAILAPFARGDALDPQNALLALGAVAALIVVVRYGMGPLLTVIARSKADEVFTAAALLVVIGSALAMHAVGLSMAMGAFIAGVLMADTEFRHQLETDIEPFRGLLLGLFFMGFGMSVDWSLVAGAWWVVLGGAFGLFAIKGLALYTLARIARSDQFDAVRIAATLGQGGEFAFVMFSAATSNLLIGREEGSILSAIVTLSMVLTPFAIKLADRQRPREDDGEADGRALEEAENTSILVAGFGRVGQVVARVMRMRGYDVTVIDNSTRLIRMGASMGATVYYGDARRLDVLKMAGAAQADMIFLCIDDRDGAKAAVEKIRAAFPEAFILADTYDRFSEVELREAGAHEVVRETFESAVELARRGLHRMGDGDVAEDLIAEFRRRDAELARLQTQYGVQEGLQKLREKYTLDQPG